MFGIRIAQRKPGAIICALDSADVLDVAADSAKRAGVQNRFHRIPGDLFEFDLGDDYDLILVTNFVHMFVAATIGALLRRVRASLNRAGQVATVEFVPNEDRVSPPVAPSFSMMMLTNTDQGDVYTLRDWVGCSKRPGSARAAFTRSVPTGVAHPEATVARP